MYCIQYYNVLLTSDIDNAHDDFRSILASLQKPVLYGVSGSICHLLYRTMLLFCEQFEDKMKEDVERSVNMVT